MSGDGRLVTTPVQGWSGEIALLCRVPRTATDRAATDRHLQALRCDRFLPGRHGVPPSVREAGTSVEEMLDRFRPGDRLTTMASRDDIEAKIRVV